VTVSVLGMAVHDFPGLTGASRVSEAHIVRDNVDLIGILLANQVRQDRADNRLDTRRHNYDGNVVLLGECMEFLEAGVKLDVLASEFEHLSERTVD
jgi:hypothetical protein